MLQEGRDINGEDKTQTWGEGSGSGGTDILFTSHSLPTLDTPTALPLPSYPPVAPSQAGLGLAP